MVLLVLGEGSKGVKGIGSQVEEANKGLLTP